MLLAYIHGSSAQHDHSLASFQQQSKDCWTVNFYNPKQYC